jgi:hypothetical protein
MASYLPVADDVAVCALASGEAVGGRNPAHRYQRLQQQAHSVVHCMGHLDLAKTDQRLGQSCNCCVAAFFKYISTNILKLKSAPI